MGIEIHIEMCWQINCRGSVHCNCQCTLYNVIVKAWQALDRNGV